jgi:topoisomerase-4 subunit B
LLRSKAVLLAGVTVTLNIEKTAQTTTWRFENGLVDYMAQAIEHSELLVPLFLGEQYATADDDNFALGEGAQWVVAWTEEGALARESYVISFQPQLAAPMNQAYAKDCLGL